MCMTNGLGVIRHGKLMVILNFQTVGDLHVTVIFLLLLPYKV
jgi:hypothetical protein